MVKADVDHRFDSQEDVCLMLKTWFPASEVISFRKLRGGYSGTNYLVEDQENHFYVIKICHGYNIDEVDTQVQLAAYLANHGYDKCCRPYALPSSDGIVRYVSKVADGEPMILLSYLPGKAGDVLIENHLLGSEDALRQVGYHLAQMHAVPLQSPHYEMLRHYLVDGICFLGRHIKHEYSQAFTTHGEEYIREHPFVKFYMHRYEAFLDCLHSCGQSRLSIVHGDPFLDNVLFTDQSPIKLLGFVDFEDACVGPSIIDVACCLVGNCFETNPEDNSVTFKIDLMKNFMLGYFQAVREQGSAANMDSIRKEFVALPTVLSAALMLNASWRFQNFNIAFPEMRKSHGEKYLELQQRIEVLEQEEVLSLVRSTITETLLSELH